MKKKKGLDSKNGEFSEQELSSINYVSNNKVFVQILSKLK